MIPLASALLFRGGRTRSLILQAACQSRLARGVQNNENSCEVFEVRSRASWPYLALASAIAIPVMGAADAAVRGFPLRTPRTPRLRPRLSPPRQTQPLAPSKEGFWGRINPFARKKWVKRQTDPINDRLTELDEVNAKNAQRHQGCGCAGAGWNPEGADPQPMRPTRRPWPPTRRRRMRATPRSRRLSTLTTFNTTVNGLDQYHQITEAEIKFRAGSTVLTSDSKAHA